MDFCPKWSPICANILPVMQCNTLTSSCTPFPLNMVKIRTVKTVSEKMQPSGYPNMSKSRLSSLLFKWKIRLLLAIFWHFWTNKTGCGQRLKGQNQNLTSIVVYWNYKMFGPTTFQVWLLFWVPHPHFWKIYARFLDEEFNTESIGTN